MSTVKLPAHMERRTARLDGLTFDEALAWAKSQGAFCFEYLGTGDVRHIFVYRPAPGFPGEYGRCLILNRDDGYSIDNAWILAGEVLGYECERIA